MRVLFDAIEQSFEINQIYGVIEELYSCAGTDYIKCMECDYKSEHQTKFYDLQLAIKNAFQNVSQTMFYKLQINNDSIEKAIFGYLKPEILDGYNKYACSVCDKKVQAQKGFRLNKLPKIFTL